MLEIKARMCSVIQNSMGLPSTPHIIRIYSAANAGELFDVVNEVHAALVDRGECLTADELLHIWEDFR
jgi:hypothetical protein